MTHIIQPWALGATLYIPSTHHDLSSVFDNTKHVSVRSLVVCFEDAIREDEIDSGLENLTHSIQNASLGDQFRFIRPRNLEVLDRILQVPNVEQAVHGFVLPKICANSALEYLARLKDTPFVVMPTLETAEMLDEHHLKELRSVLLSVRERVVMLRVGGNDLLHQMGLRRSRHGTIYDTPLNLAISKMVHVFKPFDFHLSAPVFEFIDRMDNLENEIGLDLMNGLTCKTAIHPDQVKPIERMYRVEKQDLAAAQRILDVNSPAVFKVGGAMCEPATHRRWAEQIVVRASVYGTV